MSYYCIHHGVTEGDDCPHCTNNGVPETARPNGAAFASSDLVGDCNRRWLKTLIAEQNAESELKAAKEKLRVARTEQKRAWREYIAAKSPTA